MIFYKDNKKTINNDLALSMENILSNKTASENIIENESEKLISDLNRCSEIFEDLGNVKAAEIITKILEKIAGK